MVEDGIDGLSDAVRPGVPRKITDEMVEELVVKTMETKPKGDTHEFLDVRNDNPTPFKWTKTADEILASVAAFCYRTLEAHDEL